MFWFRNDLMKTLAMSAALAGLTVTNGGIARVLPPAPASPADRWTYADVADLFAAAPITLRARIVAATRIKEAVTAPGTARFYVEADVISLIRGSAAVPQRVNYLADVPTDSRGKPPRLTKADVLVAALPVAGRPNEIRLAARDAQVMWSPALEARVRAVIAAALAPDAAPLMTGVGSAFHVAGSIPGEGETQLFLTTATGTPVSLSIIRRPGQEPRWAMALGEIVDEAAAPPARDTLAWYRLACFLPRALPGAATGELAPADTQSARDDYAFVLAQLGPCPRTRT